MATRTLLMVGESNRIVGRAIADPKAKAPAGIRLVEDDPEAKIGQVVDRGLVIKKKGRVYVAEITDQSGDTVNLIVVEEGNEPPLGDGQSMRELVNG